MQILYDFAGHTHSCPKDYGGKIFLKFSKKFLYYDKRELEHGSTTQGGHRNFGEEITFDELKGALILISYDAVSTEDANQAWHNVLPYAFVNGNLLLDELDGEEDC